MISYRTAATRTRYAAAWKIAIPSRPVGAGTLYGFDLLDSEGYVAARSNLDYYTRHDAVAAAKARARLGNI